MNRLDRLTAILIQLQSKRIVRAQEIAENFSISLRTVYRDVRSLETAGVPILGEAGVGYSLVDGYRLPPVQFSPQEAAAFLTAEKLVVGFTDIGLQRQFKSGMFKIRSVLRSKEKDSLETLDDSVEVMSKPGAAGTGFLATILQGISDHELLTLFYQGKTGELDTQRRVEPLGVYYRNDQWYLWAWCCLRDEERNFRLDRIQRLQPSGQFFTERGLNLQDHLAGVKGPSPHLKASILVENEVNLYISGQKEQQGLVSESNHGKHTELCFETPSYEYLARWMMQFADKILSVSPPELEDTLQRILAKAVKRPIKNA